MKPITIRRADKREVKGFFSSAFPPDAVRPAMLECARVTACDELYVAQVDGRIIAAVTLATTGLYPDTRPTLATLFVSQAHHRQGVGGQLCEFAIRRFIELGRIPVYVEVTSGAMKSLIARLPDDLRASLNADYVVDSYGDEWEFFASKDGGG